MAILKGVRILWPIISVLVLVVIAGNLINYHPLNTLLSSQLVSYSVKNASNANLDSNLAILQHAYELNPDNCEVYPLLGNIYENQAVAKSGNADAPDKDLLLKAVGLYNNSQKRCSGTRFWFLSEQALARDYYFLGNFNQSISTFKDLSIQTRVTILIWENFIQTWEMYMKAPAII